jgi:RNA polymerase sigma-70 factor (ECF subfamily)
MAKHNLHQTFHEIIEQHKGLLFNVVRTYCENEEDRQDLIQEIRIQIWKSLPKYDANFAMTTWLYRISINVSISYYRKNSIIHQYAKAETLPTVTDAIPNDLQEKFNLLEKFIAELNEMDKALIMLYLEDKSHFEISEIMGISISNVGTKMGRIKEKLKKRFLNHKEN